MITSGGSSSQLTLNRLFYNKGENVFTKLGDLCTEEKELLANLKKAAQKSVKPALKEAFSDLKEIIPNIVAVKWDQFTPHFNDGDTCEFGVYDALFKVEGSNQEESEYEDGFNDAYGDEWNKLDAKQRKAFETFSNKIQSVESMLESAFGDHATVTLSSKEIEVEHCEHD